MASSNDYHIVAKCQAELDAEALARLVLQLALQVAAAKQRKDDAQREAA